METTVFETMKRSGFTMLEEAVSAADYRKKFEDDLVQVLNYFESNEEIIVHDDHNSGTETRNISAVVILANGRICESFTTEHHCLNPLYIDADDNTLHLSTMSCAGNIYTTKSADYYPEAIKEYNESMLDWLPSNRIVAYKIF